MSTFRPQFFLTPLLALALTVALTFPCLHSPQRILSCGNSSVRPSQRAGSLPLGLPPSSDLTPAVYAIGFDGLFVIHPGEENWTLVASRRELRADEDALRLAREYPPRQQLPQHLPLPRWGRDVGTGGRRLNIAPVHTPAGALICPRRRPLGHRGAEHRRRAHLGTRSTCGPPSAGASSPSPSPHSPFPPSLPGGRIVAGGNDAIVYSDDDGFSWEPTNIYAGFRYRINSIVRAPWGLLYAAVNDFAVNDIGGVWESADGAVWAAGGANPGPSRQRRRADRSPRRLGALLDQPRHDGGHPGVPLGGSRADVGGDGADRGRGGGGKPCTDGGARRGAGGAAVARCRPGGGAGGDGRSVLARWSRWWRV